MGSFIYTMLWIAAVGLDIVFLLAQVLPENVWIPPFEALAIFNLLIVVLGPPEEN